MANEKTNLLESMVDLVHFSANHRPHELPRNITNTRESLLGADEADYHDGERGQTYAACRREETFRNPTEKRTIAITADHGRHDRLPGSPPPHPPPGHSASAVEAAP